MPFPPQPRDRNGFRIAIICALSSEADCVQVLFDKVYEKKYGKAPGDPNAYTIGVIAEHNVVLAYMPNMGKVSASAVAQGLASSFLGIKLALLVGICGVAPLRPDGEEIIMGDIIVSTAVIQYDFGRQYPHGFERKMTLDDELGRASPSIRSLLAQLNTYLYRQRMQNCLPESLSKLRETLPRSKYPGADKDQLYDDAGELVVRERLSDSAVEHVPMVHFGNVGCADTVMKSAADRNVITKDDGVIGFEMEGAGVWEKFPTVVIKAACDYADNNKNKHWQNYAAACAAACMKAVLTVWIPEDDFVERGLWNVPFDRNRGFFGRASELQKLKDMLVVKPEENFIHQVVSLVGLGGMGKSRLALEMAYRMRDDNPHRSVFWIQANDRLTFERDMMDIGRKLKIPGIEDEKADIKTLVKQFLSNEDAHDWFMILDNADDVDLWGRNSPPSGDPDLTLTQHLPKTSNGSILVTTRTREVAVFQSGKSVVELQEMQPAEAVQTLQNLLLNPDTPCDTPETMALLENLTYLPLAIVQAASYLNEKQASIQTYLELLEEAGENVAEILEEDFGDPTRYRNAHNPVATTWIVSFEHIRRHEPLATKYLTFMACLQEKNIPESLLPEARSKKAHTDAIGILTGYAFIRRQTENQNRDPMYDMHRLVHLATRNWLSKEELLSAQRVNVIKSVAAVLPWYYHEYKDLWSSYLPHARLLCAASSEKDLEERFVILQKIADSFLSRGFYAEAENLAYEVVRWREDALGRKHLDTIRAYRTLGQALNMQGKWRDAMAYLQKAVDGEKAIHGLEHHWTVYSMSRLSDSYRSQGNLKEAEKLDLEVLEIGSRVDGDDHPCTLITALNLASTYWYQERYEEAEELQLRVLEIRKRAFDDDHPGTLDTTLNLASTYSQQERYEEAEELSTRTLEIHKRVSGEDHPNTLTAMTNLGRIYSRQQRYEEAKELEVPVLETKKRVLGDDHPLTLISMSNLARTLHDIGSILAAIDMMRDCVQRMARALGDDHPYTKSSVKCMRAWQDSVPGKAPDDFAIDTTRINILVFIIAVVSVLVLLTMVD